MVTFAAASSPARLSVPVKTDYVCRLCNQTGHYIRDCPRFLCNECDGKEGNHAETCKNHPDRRRDAAAQSRERDRQTTPKSKAPNTPPPNPPRTRTPSNRRQSPNRRSRDCSPQRRQSRSPQRRQSRSPQRRQSRSPQRRQSRSPQRRQSRSPLRRQSRSPKRQSRGFDRRESRSPKHRQSRSPPHRQNRNRSPQRRQSRGSSRDARRERPRSPLPRRRTRTRSRSRDRVDRSGRGRRPGSRSLSRDRRRADRASRSPSPAVKTPFNKAPPPKTSTPTAAKTSTPTTASKSGGADGKWWSSAIVPALLSAGILLHGRQVRVCAPRGALQPSQKDSRRRLRPLPKDRPLRHPRLPIQPRRTHHLRTPLSVVVSQHEMTLSARYDFE